MSSEQPTPAEGDIKDMPVEQGLIESLTEARDALTTPAEGEGPYTNTDKTVGGPGFVAFADDRFEAVDFRDELNRLAGENKRLQEKNKLHSELLSLSEQAGLEDDQTLNNLHDQLAAANARVRELEEAGARVRAAEAKLREHESRSAAPTRELQTLSDDVYRAQSRLMALIEKGGAA